MSIEVTEASAATLADYARIPIAFEVRHVLAVEEREGGSADSRCRSVPSPCPT